MGQCCKPIWEWFIPPIYGDFWFIIVLPTLDGLNTLFLMGKKSGTIIEYAEHLHLKVEKNRCT